MIRNNLTLPLRCLLLADSLRCVCVCVCVYVGGGGIPGREWKRIAINFEQFLMSKQTTCGKKIRRTFQGGNIPVQQVGHWPRDRV